MAESKKKGAKKRVACRILEARRNRKLSQRAIAARLGISPTTWQSYEKGATSPPADVLLRIAAVLEVDPSWLLGSDGGELNAMPFEVEWLPLVGRIPAGPPSGWDEVKERFPVLRQLASPDCVCLRVTGDSMHPQVCNGDVAIVQVVSEAQAADWRQLLGKICVINIDGGYTIKRLVTMGPLGDEQPTLLPANPDYPPTRLADGEVPRIVGIVIGVVWRGT
jgi:SOS-response transcriptional repressor LexA